MPTEIRLDMTIYVNKGNGAYQPIQYRLDTQEGRIFKIKEAVVNQQQLPANAIIFAQMELALAFTTLLKNRNPLQLGVGGVSLED